jgi:hypothetical protein
VDNHPDDHEFKRKRISISLGKRNHDSLHEKVDGDAVEDSGHNSLVHKEADTAAGYIENRRGTERDYKMQREAEQCSWDAASVRGRAEDASRNSLQETERLGTHRSVDDERGSDVHDSADGSRRNDGLGWIGHGEALRLDSAQPEFRRILDGFAGRTNRAFKPLADYSGGFR